MLAGLAFRAGRGFDLEREQSLGGNALRLGRSAEGADVPAAVKALAARARRHPLLTVHASCQVVRRQGHAGQFTVTLRSAGSPARDTPLRVGAVVVATGAEEFRGAVYGLGSSQRVLTLLDPGARLRQEPDLPSRLGSVAFIGCVGPWDQPGSGQAWRCSRGCCETMVRQARALKEANPAAQVAVLVREVNTYGFREEEHTAARRAGVLFTRFPPDRRPRLSAGAGGLELTVVDSSLQETHAFRPDLVVLAAVDRAYCRKQGLPVFRREVGGGAVYLDGRQIFFQLVLSRENPLARGGARRRFSGGSWNRWPRRTGTWACRRATGRSTT